MNAAFFYKLALLPNNYFAVVSVIVIGLYFVDQKNFFYITISTLFSIILSAYLKSIWQIPLNPELNKLGWSYPSTHTVFNVVFYSSIFLFYRKLWIAGVALTILISGFFAMVYFHYHIWIDIMGGICVAGLVLIPLYYWVQHAFKAQLQFGLLLAACSFMLLLFLPKLPFNYGWDWQVLGFIVGLTICNETISLKRYNKTIKIMGICLLVPVILGTSKAHLQNEFVLSLLLGIMISMLIFLAVPLANRSLAIVKQQLFQ